MNDQPTDLHDYASRWLNAVYELTGSWNEVGEVAGLSPHTVKRIAADPSARVRSDTIEQIWIASDRVRELLRGANA